MDEVKNVVEASGENHIEAENNNKDNNNNNNFERVSSFNETKEEKDTAQSLQKVNQRKKLFSSYIYQQDYEEALKSLLWEPYDCRDDFDAWYYRPLDRQELGLHSQIYFSSSESSVFSISSCSSVDESLNTEIKFRNVLKAEKNLHLKPKREWKKGASRFKNNKLEKDLKQIKTIETSALVVESKLRREEEQFSGFFESKCTIDPVQHPTKTEKMVSDLHFENGNCISSCNGRNEAQKLYHKEISASASQYEFGCNQGEHSARFEKDDLKAVSKMLVTVEGTLEPRDSNEGTHLVSPDASLDLNDNPVRLTNSTRSESDFGGNVSVVNCYRAVPVAVVSTVPTIKCRNTQESFSNVNVIQTSSNPDPKLHTSKTSETSAKRQVPPLNNDPVPSTSKIRTKVPSRDLVKNSVHSYSAVKQSVEKNETPVIGNSSLNEITNEQKGQTLSSRELLSTESDSGNLTMANHNRSVSNPVLGNQIHLVQNSFGSQQNIPVRLETHFGPNSPDGAENSRMYLMQGSSSNVETPILPQVENDTGKPNQRIFISTEAQTDDVPLDVNTRRVVNREQRRRERRERRHQRRLHQNILNSGSVWQTNVDIVHRDRRGLPDILNSHMPPPYSAVTMPPIPTMSSAMHVAPSLSVPPGSHVVPHLIESSPAQNLPHQNSFRFPFSFPGGGRRVQSQGYAHEEESPKSCCGVVVTQTVSIRWFIVMISFVGICCVIVGTVLGAMKASGREHLTVSLLMIGVGIVLVTVSVVAWRLTSQDAPSCRSMLGLGNTDDSGNEPNQRFVPRMPPSYGRPHHPYAAMMYPEFQYRPPPPSYQASMQEYRLRLLLLERPNNTTTGLQTAISPPPTYRSQTAGTVNLRPPPLCRSLPQSEYSHPPSYRSRTSSTRPTLDPNGETLSSVNHSRNSSLLSHVSDQNGNVSQAVVNVISVMGNPVDLCRADTDIQIESIKLGVDEEVPIPPIRMLLNKGKRSPTTSIEETKSENVNLVTIVTVSDNNSTSNRDHSVESDVLAHL